MIGLKIRSGDVRGTVLAAVPTRPDDPSFVVVVGVDRPAQADDRLVVARVRLAELDAGLKTKGRPVGWEEGQFVSGWAAAVWLMVTRADPDGTQ